MAPLLRAGFHGLRCSRLAPFPSLSSQRELLKPPESSYVLWRWYGESAALEETCGSTQIVIDTAGESRAVIEGENLSKMVDEQKPLKEVLAANIDKQEGAAKEPSSALDTDKLTGLIMEKIRSKNNSNGLKDSVTPSQTKATSSETTKLPVGSRQKIAEDKWNQVMNSMRNMAAKKKQNMVSGGAMPSSAKLEEGDNQDDFADLDLPQVQDAAVPSRAPSKSDSLPQPAMDTSRNFTPNVKSKEGNMQGLNGKQKANGLQGFQQKVNEMKPTSFSFLKSLDATTSFSGVEGDESADSRKQKMKSASAHPHYKPSDRWKISDSSKSPQAAYYEAEDASSHEVKSGISCEVEKFTVEKERDLKHSKETISALSRTNYLGYTVCIQNLPRQSNLGLVKEVLSLYGEVISAFKQSNSDGSSNAFVEFKSAEAMDGALASRSVIVDSKAFTIVRVDAPITTVVRLSRVSADTSDSQVACICKKFGSIDHVKWRANGVYDVYYKANELMNMSAIIESLNEVTLNQRRLVALSAPRLLPALRKETLKRSEGQAWQASQFSEILNRIETGLEAVSVYFEDLKSLAAMDDEITKLQ